MSLRADNSAILDVRTVLEQHLLVDGFPLVFDLESSRGSWAVDARSGDRYLDLFSFFASLPLGFNHPVFQDKDVRRRLLQAAIHKPSNSDAYTEPFARFVETFADAAMDESFRYLFFVEGGALAVENALKTAFDWKVRKNLRAGRGPLGTRVLHFEDAFHGRTGYTLSLTNTDPVKTVYFPKFDWPRVPAPCLRFPITPEEIQRVAAAEEESLLAIEAAFEHHPDDIAAIVIEPIQGEGGDHHFRPEFLRALREEADRRDALLIFDEVQTGFGLTGRFWAYEHSGAVPDIVCFGKKSQVCGIMVTERVDDVPDNVFHVSSRINSTWGGSLVDMVRCGIILRVMREENLVERAAATGKVLLSGLERLARAHPSLVSNVRGTGLFCAFDLPDAEIRSSFLRRAVEHRILILGSGKCTVRFRPALTIGEEEIEFGLRTIAKVLSELETDDEDGED